MARSAHEARVWWVTGLAGAGKTTIARAMIARLSELGIRPVLLDGDELRQVVGPDLAYDPDSRRELARRYGRLCKLLSEQGIEVVCATISMFEDARRWNRQNIPRYVEIYVKVPMAELKRRNQKQLYRGKRSTEVWGIDIDPEEPLMPDIILLNDGSRTLDELVDNVMAHAATRSD